MNMSKGYTTMSKFIQSAWPHRDEKLNYDIQRDIQHKKRIPNAFEHGEVCLQSSLYLTDCDSLENDTFAFCPGSHKWHDEPNWIVSGDRHQVTVDPKDITTRSVKLAARSGDLVIWKSTTIHWGHPGVSGMIPARAKEIVTLPLWRNEVSLEDIEGIRNGLQRDGACVIPLITQEEVETLKTQFVKDGNELFKPDVPYTQWDQVPTIGSGKGGSAAPTLTLSKWAWDARLHSKRVELFRRLLGEDEICVGLDSVHYNPKGNRLCSMASFSPRRERTDEAFKRKCVAAAWGRWRMTHWAAHGDLSKFCYGNRFEGPRAFSAVDSTWVGWAAEDDKILKQLQDASFGTARSCIERLASSLTMEEVRRLIKSEIIEFL